MTRLCPNLLTATFCAFISVFGARAEVAAQSGASILTLDEAIAELSETNLDVAAAEQQLAIAELQLRQARTVIYPTITLDALYILNDETVDFGGGNVYVPIEPYITTVFDEFGQARNLDDPSPLFEETGGGGVSQNRHDFRGSITLEQTLFNARSRPGIRYVDAQVDVADAAVDQVRYLLAEPLIQAYYSAVLAMRVIEIRERDLALAQLSLERAVAAFETEVGNRFEVTRAQVEVSTAERAVENARLGYELARDGVATLLDMPGDFDVELPAEHAVPADVNDDGAFALDRPDLRIFDEQVDAQRYQLNQVRGQWYPVVTAQFQVAAARETAFSGDPYGWSLTIAANWLLYDAGYRRFERQIQEERTLAFELDREREHDRISAALRQLALQIAQEEQNIASATAQVDLAQESLELAQDALELGVATTLDVQVARQQLAQAELAHVTSEISLQALIAQLEWVRGAE